VKILVLGATGMAGHTISLYLKEQGHNIVAFSRRPFPLCENVIGDARSLVILDQVIADGKFDAVINCIGMLNYDAEKKKDQAVFLNGYLPHHLVSITKKIETKIIQISTDCVFSGEIGMYEEDSLRDGETFYDRSKAIGEIDNDKDLTFRNSIIGPDMNENGIGLFNWFMEQEGEIEGYNKATWTGVTTLTLAKAIEKAIIDKLSGLYHLVNNEVINKYELLKLFNKHFKNNEILINKNNEIIVNKSLVNTRNDFDFIVPSYENMIMDMKNWVIIHKELYSHYDVEDEITVPIYNKLNLGV